MGAVIKDAGKVVLKNVTGRRTRCQGKSSCRLYCKQTWVTLVGDKSLGRRFHNFQQFRGLGGQGAERDIPRHWDLRRWGGKISPAVSDGEKVISSGPVCARPGLPAFIPLAPEPTSRWWGMGEPIVLPMFVARTKAGF